ncbi:MAG TPA: hypothetical protein VGQ15_10285 [Gaiellaceae bacterium]|nr:hypothetical protein [Gaiellaceae bacterium]
MVAVSITWFIPIFVLAAILLLFGSVLVLGRVRGGRYLRPVIGVLAKIPFMRTLLQKASRKAIERSNPELASAMAKLERSGATRDPQRAEAALSRLTASERQAYLDAANEMGTMPEAVNRAQRRRMEKMRKAQRGR